MKASRSFHVIGANRGHSFPPIWVKMALLNLPSAVRRAALARTPVAAGLGTFGAFGALGALAAAGGACLVSPFTRRTLFVLRAIYCSLHGTRLTIRVFRE